MQFRLLASKDNLLSVFLMQQATFLNIKMYKALKSKDFSLETTQKEHALLTEQSMQLWIPLAVQEFSYIYDERVWQKGREGLSKIYRIQPRQCPIVHLLKIDFDKSLQEATSVRYEVDQHMSDFVKINVFDVKFTETKGVE